MRRVGFSGGGETADLCPGSAVREYGAVSRRGVSAVVSSSENSGGEVWKHRSGASEILRHGPRNQWQEPTTVGEKTLAGEVSQTG